ncbi:unnamed protein product [Rotaria sordida]|uniref:Uncharacterized protein n=1 Tax=Rotaria sordida TaxID=392033 RepID=A0A814TZH3_9BILA|nr:unnamed protein product [Rotaria sordida]
MLSAFELSQFSKQWTNVPEEVFIRGGLALIAIGTTGYILNKIFNSSPAENSSEERPATQSMLTNRPYSAVVKEHLRATYAHFAGGLVMTGAPLMAGLSVAFLASISPIILPDTTIRTLPILETIKLIDI